MFRRFQITIVTLVGLGLALPATAIAQAWARPLQKPWVPPFLPRKGGFYGGPTDTVPPGFYVPAGAWGFGSCNGCAGPCIQPLGYLFINWPAAPPGFQGQQAWVTQVTLGNLRQACNQNGQVTLCIAVRCTASGIYDLFVYDNFPPYNAVYRQLGCAKYYNLRLDVDCSAYAPYLQPQYDQYVAFVILVRCCSGQSMSDGLEPDESAGDFFVMPQPQELDPPALGAGAGEGVTPAFESDGDGGGGGVVPNITGTEGGGVIIGNSPVVDSNDDDAPAGAAERETMSTAAGDMQFKLTSLGGIGIVDGTDHTGTIVVHFETPVGGKVTLPGWAHTTKFEWNGQRWVLLEVGPGTQHGHGRLGPS